MYWNNFCAFPFIGKYAHDNRAIKNQTKDSAIRSEHSRSNLHEILSKPVAFDLLSFDLVTNFEDFEDWDVLWFKARKLANNKYFKPENVSIFKDRYAQLRKFIASRITCNCNCMWERAFLEAKWLHYSAMISWLFLYRYLVHMNPNTTKPVTLSRSHAPWKVMMLQLHLFLHEVHMPFNRFQLFGAFWFYQLFFNFVYNYILFKFKRKLIWWVLYSLCIRDDAWIYSKLNCFK